MKVLNFAGLVRPRTAAAQQSFDRFWERYQSNLEQLNRIIFDILVWGPSLQSNSKLANKRIEIWNSLNDDGHNAMMSEEFTPMVDSQPRRQLSLKTLELAQAKAVHIIIILLGVEAIGAQAEMADFGNRSDIARKVFVLAPKAMRSSYPGQGSLWILDKALGGVYWYDDSELDSCNVLTEALTRVQALRQLEANDPTPQARGQS